jgi:hypothetical protein
LQSTRKKEQSHIKGFAKNVTFLANLKGSEAQVCGDVNLLLYDYDSVKIDLSGKIAYAHAQAKLFR